LKSRVIRDRDPRTWALIFRSGDELAAGLRDFANEHHLTASSFKGIGAFRSAVLGYCDWEKKDYKRIAIDEQVEVLSLIGDIALNDGKPSVHAHVVVGKSDGTAHGGHLLEASVRPTVEVIVTESPESLQKQFDPETGLALIAP
jgi:predicted DNA-binding protein with PD1-like motif